MTITDTRAATPTQRAVELFPNDVAEHVMTIVNDDNGVRHLRFAKPGTWNHGFYVTSWPNHLALSGDMGVLVLTNHDADMLDWARDLSRHEPSWHYWTQKLAQELRPGAREFSSKSFVDHVRNEVEDRPYGEARDLVETALGFDDEQEAREWADRHFQDSWEWDVKDLTFHTAWGMLALRMAANLFWEATTDLDKALPVGEVLLRCGTRDLGDRATIVGHQYNPERTGSASRVDVTFTDGHTENTWPLPKFLGHYRTPTKTEIEAL